MVWSGRFTVQWSFVLLQGGVFVCFSAKYEALQRLPEVNSAPLDSPVAQQHSNFVFKERHSSSYKSR